MIGTSFSAMAAWWRNLRISAAMARADPNPAGARW
jgi:hypothetical protein